MFSHLFDWVLFAYFQDFYENLMMFWVIFMQKYRRFTNFQAALFGWFILAVIPCLHTRQKQKKPSKKHLKRCKLIYSGIRPSHQPYTAHLTEYTVIG